MEQGAWVTVLDWVCRLTAFIAPALSLRGTYMAWRNRSLGAGGRRPEPTLAALMCNVVWFIYGIRVADSKLEPVILNGWGGLLQMVYLAVFLLLGTREERDRVIIPAACAWVYICSTFFISYGGADVLNRFCTVAGWVSGLAPLLTIAFLSDEWTTDILPYWGVSAFCMVHGALWVTRAFTMEKGPLWLARRVPVKEGPNYSMLTQNGITLVCNFILLMLAWRWRPTVQTQPTATPRSSSSSSTSIINADILELAREAQAQGVTLSTTEAPGQPRRRRPATDDASTFTTPAGQHAPAPPTHRNGPPTSAHQPVQQAQPRRSPRFQADVPTTGGDQVPPALPAHSNGAPTSTHQPVPQSQPRRSRRLQADVPTTGGDQVPPAPPAHSNSAPTSAHQPVPQAQPRRSPRFQDAVPTTAGDQVPPAPSTHNTSTPTSGHQPVSQPRRSPSSFSRCRSNNGRRSSPTGDTVRVQKPRPSQSRIHDKTEHPSQSNHRLVHQHSAGHDTAGR